MDNLMPEVASIGMVDNANVTEDVNYALKPVNNFIQNFTWITGLIYIFGIIAIFGLAFAFKSSGDKWLMGLFFGLVLILIIACIILSNIYEEFYNGTDTDFTPILQEHVILSYLILYNPAIMSILAFFAGIILFSGPSEEGI
jgi:phosphoglycerol transferase MdoB-like AlkP superfamily enzyme